MASVIQQLLLSTSVNGHRYWRIHCTAFNTILSLRFREVELRVGGTDQVPVMVAITTSGVTVTSSNYISVGYEGWRAFDGGTDLWAVSYPANPEWLKVDFGASNEKQITSYTITPGSADDLYMASDFTLDWSDNDADWTTVNTQTGLTTGWVTGTPRVFTV